MKDLSIIIVSYNTKDILKECLDSIVNSVSKKIDYEIIVVDNASSDGSVEEMQKLPFDFAQGKKLKIIVNEENLGFSKANNVGVKEAKGGYLLFLNSDTVMYENTLETMVVFMDEHADAGAATCKVMLTNGQIDDASHRGFPTPWNALTHFSGFARMFPKSRIFAGYSLGWENLESIHEVDALVGAFMMVRREAGEQVGWWDEDYFFYGEDLDFCYKLKETGWKVYYVPTVSILHYKGVSGGIKEISKDITKADMETKKRVTKARFDAMRKFYKKHYIKKYPSLVTWLVIAGINLKHKLSLDSIK